MSRFGYNMIYPIALNFKKSLHLLSLPGPNLLPKFGPRRLSCDDTQNGGSDALRISCRPISDAHAFRLRRLEVPKGCSCAVCLRDFTPESEALVDVDVDVGCRFSLCLLATSTAPFDAIAPYSAFLQRRIIG
jgi:hypothetical protein